LKIKKMKKSSLGFGKAILIFILFYLIYSALSILFYFLFKTHILSNNPELYEFLDIIPYFIVLIVILIYKRKNEDLQLINHSDKLGYKLLILLLLPVLFRISVDPLFRINELLSISDIPSLDSLDQNKERGSVLSKSLVFFNVVVLVPIVEEYIFRGFIIKALSKNKSIIIIFFSSFLFALIHITESLTSVFVAFLLGIVLSTITLKRGLFYSIVFHMIYNLIWFISSIYSIEYWSLIIEFNFNLFYWLITSISLFGLIFLVQRILKTKSK